MMNATTTFRQKNKTRFFLEKVSPQSSETRIYDNVRLCNVAHFSNTWDKEEKIEYVEKLNKKYNCEI
ncbi:hypothetical protein ACQKNX_08100 [Lysinibacillus sp. NPDC093712]|uniref:hypothetical protein n=1 Tax=Lysinibacillus sp. NPDC093712 TaxID=3390579 RepID=UPI003D0201A9